MNCLREGSTVAMLWLLGDAWVRWTYTLVRWVYCVPCQYVARTPVHWAYVVQTKTLIFRVYALFKHHYNPQDLSFYQPPSQDRPSLQSLVHFKHFEILEWVVCILVCEEGLSRSRLFSQDCGSIIFSSLCTIWMYKSSNMAYVTLDLN